MTVAAPVVPATITRKHILSVRLLVQTVQIPTDCAPEHSRKPERVEESVHADLLIFA